MSAEDFGGADDFGGDPRAQGRTAGGDPLVDLMPWFEFTGAAPVPLAAMAELQAAIHEYEPRALVDVAERGTRIYSAISTADPVRRMIGIRDREVVAEVRFPDGRAMRTLSWPVRT